MDIVIQKEIKITLNEIKILSVRDIFKQKKIIAKIENLDKPVILWQGDEEYEQAGVWTNESVLERATEVLSKENIPWAY